MLVTFSSKADMDILMLEKHALAVLVAAGKLEGPEIPERGVFSVEQIDDAIQRLEDTIAREKDYDASRQKILDQIDDELPPSIKEHVHLGQRATPLLQMLRKSKAQNTPVLWETGSGW